MSPAPAPSFSARLKLNIVEWAIPWPATHPPSMRPIMRAVDAVRGPLPATIG